MFEAKTHIIEDLSEQYLSLDEIKGEGYGASINTLKIIKFKNEEESLIWNDIREYKQFNGIPRTEIEKEELAIFLDDLADDFVDYPDGFIKVQEGLFFFDWDNRTFKIVEWGTEDKEIRQEIIHSVEKAFEELDEYEEEDYYEGLKEGY